MTAQQYIKHLQLLPHPEGGYFKEIYRSKNIISKACLPDGFLGNRNISTSIYYLLQQGDFSAFHKIKSDECWHFYAGGTLLIHMIFDDGNYKVVPLGNKINNEETFQFVVPANTWFASEPADDETFSLAGCTVAPGFSFDDLEMADKHIMLKQFPQHSQIIERLCR